MKDIDNKIGFDNKNNNDQFVSQVLDDYSRILSARCYI